MSLDWGEGAWQRSPPWRIGQVTLLHLCRLLRSPPIEVTFVKAQARGTLDQKGRPCQASLFQQGSWTVVPLICASPSPRLCSLFSHLNVEQKNKAGFERAGRAFLRGRPYCREKADNQGPSSRPSSPVFVDTSRAALSQATACCCPGLSLSSSGAPWGLAPPPLPLDTLRADVEQGTGQ